MLKRRMAHMDNLQMELQHGETASVLACSGDEL